MVERSGGLLQQRSRVLVGALAAGALACQARREPALGSVAKGEPPGAASAGLPATSPAATSPAATSPATVDPIGVWVGELVVGEADTGPVELMRQGSGWTVRALGTTGTCEPAPPGQALLVCKLGGSGHVVRVPAMASAAPGGSAAPDGGAAPAVPDAIDAFWVTPEIPFVVRGGFATPLRLLRTSTGSFAGRASLVATRFTSALGIGRRPTGELFGFLREREQNLGRFFGNFTVVTDGNQLELRTYGGERFAARLVPRGHPSAPQADVLELPLPDTSLVLRMARSAPSEPLAQALWPTAGAPAGALATPTALDDGWPVASLEEAGLSKPPLARLLAELSRPPRDWLDLSVHGLVIAHRGRLVVETALAGYSPQDLHDVRSVGKSFTSALAGLAADRGELGLDERVLDVLGLSSTDPRWRRMKVRHLLSMSSGLDCEDEMPGSPGDEDHMREQPEPNWHRFTLGLPMAREPGAAGVYCTAGINLIGALLARRWGGWLPQRFAERLARPLGISRFQMILMPDGEGYLGGGLRLTPRDMAKLGQLYVDGGRWQGKQLLSARYVAEATAAHAGLSGPNDYGLGFWRTSFRVGQVDYPAFYASGNGGQLIIGLPSLRAVVVFTSGNYANRRAWQRILDDLMPRYVIPALLGRP